jgi:CTD nuclear envelope phosphatase 1
MLKGIPKQNGADEVSHPCTASTDAKTITEDGLPIQEIREAPDGSTITAPEGGESAETVREDTEDYWSEEAAARRAALRRQIFHEGSDDDEDEEKEEDGGNDKMDVDPAPASLAPPRPQTPVNQPPTHSPNRSPQNPPKSILKAPSGKKSVTFDPSTRLPPDSPPVSSPIGAFGSFPVGSVVTDNVAAGLKTVPILAPPTPGRKPAPTPTFAGFKRGFLTGPGSKPPPIPAPSSAVIEGSQAVDGDGDVEMESKEGKEEKKKSIFAQRRAERAPSFPRLADAKPMVTMKTNIVEKPPSIADRIQTSGVRTTNPLPPAVGTVPPAVGAVPPVVTPAPVPSVPAPAPTPSAPVVIVDHDDDESDYGDLGEFSDDEEDEYHLDEALMQREIQLALHRGQRWQPPVDSDEEGEEDEEDDGEGTGGVLMGVPRVSTITGSDDDPLRIVNPTADDLSQFLRVGRAEDGELVFERPIVDDSGSDGEGSDGEGPAAADRRARRARRNDVMERLMRGEYEDEPVQDSPAVQAAAWKNTLPPSVGAAVPAPALAAPASAPTPAPPVAPRRIETGPVIERSSAPLPSAPAPAPSSEPKKVSRFKAARQAQS